MGIERHGGVARHVRTLMHLGAVGGWTDGQLLERYVRGDAAAEDSFAVLVERHGPMVLRVCRSILGDGADAHDAFQATFLVLVRRARSLCVRDSLGPWLYQVAWRVARCDRSESARRRRHERRAAALTATSEEAPMPGRDREAILHEELARLPERYRAPLVLCDLEGRPHELAARHLGCAVGTIKSRLSRGRDKLRARLARRGLTSTAGLGAAILIPVVDAAVPAALADSTIKLAAREAAGGVVPAAVAGLAKGALKAMLIAKIQTLAIAGLAAVLLTTGAAVVARDADAGGGRDEPRSQVPREQPRDEALQVDPTPDGEGPAVHEVRPGPLKSSIVAWGQVRSANNPDAKSEVEGEATIISLLPEGTLVTKGQLICELDSAALRDRLAVQRFAAAHAEAESEDARAAFEAAELGVGEYAEGILPREIEALDGRIELARGRCDLERARLDAREAARATELERKAAELEVKGAELALADVEREKQVLVDFTGPRKLKALRVEVGKARTALLALEMRAGLEGEKERKLVRMIEKCKLYSPGDGIVVYADPTTRPDEPARPYRIEEGAVVRERQVIFLIPDLSRMQVVADVHEARVHQVTPGMLVQVRVHAFPNEVLSGRVVHVSPVPDPDSFADRKVKVYPTIIEIEGGPPGLRPGMSAQAEIVVADLDDVLRVPIRALLEYEGKVHVAVKTPERAIEWREVTTGAANGEEVEIKQGLQAGEQVVLDPIRLLSEEERRARKLDHPTPPAESP